MERYSPINLLNLLLSLSEAMDLAGPEIVQHQLKVAFISWELGRAAKLLSVHNQNFFVITTRDACLESF